MRYIALLLLALLGLTGCATPGSPALPEQGFVFDSVQSNGREYPYAVYRPRGMDTGVPQRGLVFLHGRGECGMDGQKQLAVGLPNALLWDPDRWPFVIVFPQKPTGESEWEDHDKAVMAMLDREIQRGTIDKSRVAITGLSQGGHGTVALASKYPSRFRAAAPVCGYIGRVWHDGQRERPIFPQGKDAEKFANAFLSTPIWIFHGGKDDVVPPSESQQLHKLLNNAGMDSRLTIFPDANHNSWDKAYRESGLWDWLVEQTRAEAE